MSKELLEQFKFDTDDSDKQSSSLLSPDSEGDSVPRKKRGRRSKAEIEASQKPAMPQFTADHISPITTGLLLILEGTLKAPFTQTDPKLKAGLDEAGANCANVYGGEQLAKYAPVLQFSTCFALITIDALQKKPKKVIEPSEKTT